MKERLSYLDFFKVIGLFCVCLAHIPTIPSGLRIFRSFDVPFLMFVSAGLFSFTSTKVNYFVYIWKRFNRLVIPAWIYLIFLTILFSLTGKIDWLKMLNSFLFMKEAAYGHTWIILLYFTIALVVPVVMKIRWNIISISLIFFIQILFELFCIKTNLYSIKVLEYTLFYIIPYGCVCFFGIYSLKMSKRELLFLSLFYLIITVVCFFFYNDQVEKIVTWLDFNQPARLFYISYSLAITFFLFFLFRDKDFKLFKNKIIVFISSNSLWIYFWHSLIIMIVSKVTTFWLLEYSLVMIISILIVYCQTSFVDFLERKKYKLKSFLIYFKG